VLQGVGGLSLMKPDRGLSAGPRGTPPSERSHGEAPWRELQVRLEAGEPGAGRNREPVRPESRSVTHQVPDHRAKPGVRASARPGRTRAAPFAMPPGPSAYSGCEGVSAARGYPQQLFPVWQWPRLILGLHRFVVPPTSWPGTGAPGGRKESRGFDGREQATARPGPWPEG